MNGKGLNSLFENRWKIIIKGRQKLKKNIKQQAGIAKKARM